MANAGTVTVDFAAETAKFTAELKKVRGDLKSLKDDTSRLADGFASVGKALAGVFSAAVIGAGLRAVIKATEESDLAISQLNNSLKNAGANVAVVSGEFQAFATEMQRVSTFSDEAVIGVESLLLSFRGLSSGTIKQATADILDLSTRLGIDLNTAAKTVGKALEDPVAGMTALRKAGVQFTDDQKRLIKSLVETGDKAAAQQIILKELEARYQGAATAARDTLGGALKGVKNAFDDLLEAKQGLPGATGALNELAKTLQSDEIKQGFSALVTGIVKIIEVAAKGAAALADLGKSLGDVFAHSKVPGFDLTAAQALTQELGAAQKQLSFFQQQLDTEDKLGFQSRIKRVREEVAAQEAYIETLKERIKLAQQAQPKLDFLKQLKPAADSIISQITQPTSFTTPDVTGSESDEALKARLAASKKFFDSLKQESEDFQAQISKDVADSQERDFQQIAAFGERRLEVEQLDRDFGIERERAAAEEKLRIATEFEQALLLTRQRGALAATTLLTAYGGRFASIAKGILVIEKAMAIRQAIMDTHAAVLKTLAHFGGTPWGYAAAAGVAVYGAAQVAAIASETDIGGSSAQIGTPNNPVFTDTTSNQDQPAFGATSQSAVQITINGFVGPQVLDEMINAIKDAVGDRDVVLINKNSRNGQELVGG